jgi:hypothetical protein
MIARYLSLKGENRNTPLATSCEGKMLVQWRNSSAADRRVTSTAGTEYAREYIGFCSSTEHPRHTIKPIAKRRHDALDRIG